MSHYSLFKGSIGAHSLVVSDLWIFKYESVLTSFIHPCVSGYTVISDLDLHQADYVITNTLCESMSVCTCEDPQGKTTCLPICCSL